MGTRRRCCCTSGSTPICLQVLCSPNAVPVVGATIQLWSGSTMVDSCTTDSTGCCSFTETGTYTVKVVISGSTVYTASKTLSGTEILITLTASTISVICCGGYAIPETLTLTDAIGSLTFQYCSTCPGSGSPPTWTGGHSITGTSSTVSGICTVAPATTGPVRVCYLMTCNAGSSPKFSITRSWGDVYDPSSSQQVWYQNSAGYTPGQPCSATPPAGCGGIADVATGGANPSSSAPFAISFVMTDSPGNNTSDPIGSGDTVTVSA